MQVWRKPSYYGQDCEGSVKTKEVIQANNLFSKLFYNFTVHHTKQSSLLKYGRLRGSEIAINLNWLLSYLP